MTVEGLGSKVSGLEHSSSEQRFWGFYLKAPVLGIALRCGQEFGEQKLVPAQRPVDLLSVKFVGLRILNSQICSVPSALNPTITQFHQLPAGTHNFCSPEFPFLKCGSEFWCRLSFRAHGLGLTLRAQTRLCCRVLLYNLFWAS